jgi:hypothetical protein
MTQKSNGRKRDALILPGVLLTVALLEEIVTYKVRQRVHDVYLRTAIIVAFNGVAFTVAAELVGPWIAQFLATARRDSERRAGALGLVLFYSLAYGALYYAYYVDQVHGPGWLLPMALR